MPKNPVTAYNSIYTRITRDRAVGINYVYNRIRRIHWWSETRIDLLEVLSVDDGTDVSKYRVKFRYRPTRRSKGVVWYATVKAGSEYGDIDVEDAHFADDDAQPLSCEVRDVVRHLRDLLIQIV